MNPRLAFIVLGSLVLSACSTPTEPLPRSGLPDTGRPALHAVTDAKLRELMNQMNTLIFDRFTAQPELDRERRAYALRMAQTANTLSETVDHIRSRLPELSLNESERITFLAVADKLHDQAKTLEFQANHNQIDAITATLDQITATCSSCHALFRNRGN
ncbi:MAG: hypothetical protein H6R26_2035 [Proteobacteria bacterium]|nr:hypothetical protein [Pseudomonadota bacterium]